MKRRTFFFFFFFAFGARLPSAAFILFRISSASAASAAACWAACFRCLLLAAMASAAVSLAPVRAVDSWRPSASTATRFAVAARRPLLPRITRWISAAAFSIALCFPSFTRLAVAIRRAVRPRMSF